jgi:hypothetical protein
VTETRAITIEAQPAAIWPWLVQMGFGRAGWYSYDRIGMRGASADAVDPDWQCLSLGDIVPTDPNGGFRVAVLEPDWAMVLYGDMELWRAQAMAAAAHRAENKEAAGTPANLKAVGAVSGATLPELASSWTLYLQPIAERGETSPACGRSWSGRRPDGQDEQRGRPGRSALRRLQGLGRLRLLRRKRHDVGERSLEPWREPVGIADHGQREDDVLLHGPSGHRLERARPLGGEFGSGVVGEADHPVGSEEPGEHLLVGERARIAKHRPALDGREPPHHLVEPRDELRGRLGE